MISLQRTLVSTPCLYVLVTSEIGTTSLQGTKLLAPKCPLFGGSTVLCSSNSSGASGAFYISPIETQTITY